ncbi:ABC transporter ATP-binding protein [Mycoplasma buteonis]|uniref:ABC transporter ATP-binding protein n=1 Tax=Mycoplasma buteonis TaxID=171280 RepID=UPI00055A4EB3|nr:ABC transporter ATP-binding protein [Mycoplasma buteonis]
MRRFNLQQEPQKFKFKDLRDIFKLVPFTKKNWVALITLLFFSAAVGAAISWLTGWLVNYFFNAVNFEQTWEKNFVFYLIILAVLILFYLFNVLINILNNLILGKIFNKYSFLLRKEIYEKIQSLPMSFFENEKTGDLMAAISNDTQNISDSISNIVSSVLRVIFTFVFTLTLMFLYAPVLALISIVIIPLSAIIFLKIIGKTRAYFRKAQNAFGAYNGYLEEVLDVLPLVRVHQQHNKILKSFEKYSLAERDAGRKSVLFWHVMRPTYNFIHVINKLIIIALATYFYLHDIPSYGIVAFNFGVITSFSMYISTLTNQIMAIIDFSSTMQNGLASWDRIKRILDLESVDLDPRLTDLKVKEGQINFDNVSFSYPLNLDIKVLKNVNFQIKVGNTLALVGHTGCGKSTIAKLLAKYYSATTGNIYIDNQNAKDITEKSWRENIAIISQDVFLFEDTFLNNLKIVNPKLSEEQIKEICKLTQIDEYINSLPKGYETVIQHNGINLSQGQKQLLSITRALVSGKQIIIMDEATANIDTITEQKIQNTLNYLMKNKTMLIIAHRLSTIIDAHQILVINHGEIIEKGTHQELLNQKGYYHSLYQSGFND